MTENKKITLRISLIPLLIVLAIVAGAGYLLIKEEIKIPWFNREPQIRRLEGYPTIVYTDKDIEKVRKVIKDEQDLNETLNYLDSSGLLTLKEKINFDKEYVIVVSTGTESETGHEIKIKKLYEDKAKKQLLVSIREIESEESCNEEKDKNVAIDIIAISKTELEVSFERLKETKICNTDNKESSGSEQSN